MSITLTPTLVQTNFSETFTISTGLTSTSISSVTVTKGTGSTYGYVNLTLSTGSSSQDFKNQASLTFTGTGSSEISFTLSGAYTDFLFDDQSVKYYYNPQNIKIGIGVTNIFPQLDVNVNSSNSEAYSFTNFEITQDTETTTENVSQFYYEKPYWTEVPETVDALYSFTPSNKGPQNYNYTFTLSYDDGIGSGTSTSSVIHPATYNIEYQKIQFLNRLNNQRFNTGQ